MEQKKRTDKERADHAQYMREWRAKRDKNANKGDIKAIKSKNKDSNGGAYRSAKSYILKKATKRELSVFRELIAQRVKILNEERKK